MRTKEKDCHLIILHPIDYYTAIWLRRLSRRSRGAIASYLHYSPNRQAQEWAWQTSKKKHEDNVEAARIRMAD